VAVSGNQITKLEWFVMEYYMLISFLSLMTVI